MYQNCSTAITYIKCKIVDNTQNWLLLSYKKEAKLDLLTVIYLNIIYMVFTLTPYT